MKTQQNRFLLVGLAVLTTTIYACAFDQERLEGGDQCVSDDECRGGFCIQGVCQAQMTDLGDVGGDDDLGDFDTRQLDQGVSPDADGGPDEGGGLCDGTPVNSCGGCQPLADEPGDSCTGCGVFECGGPNSVYCATSALNGCGGCEPLDQMPGDDCGECGSVLVCESEDSLRCEGPLRNVCGGCGGPIAVLDEDCGCGGELVESHTWICMGDQPRCEDNNGQRESATVLLSTVEASPEQIINGAMADSDLEDWYVVHVRDESTPDELIPTAHLSDLSRDLDLCAYWLYDTGGTTGVDCPEGSASSVDGLNGCCSERTGVNDDSVTINNNSWFTDRLDTTIGPDNDSGRLFIRVFAPEDEPICGGYTLLVDF